MAADKRIHYLLFGNLEIFLSTENIVVRKRGIFGRQDINIPLPFITQVSVDKMSEMISIQTKSEKYTYYLGGLMTAQLLSDSLLNLL